MRWESFKSWLLTVLVLTSLILTWNLWTYQPEYEKLENATYIQNPSVSSKLVSMETIAEPMLILYHREKEELGLTDEKKRQVLFKHLKETTFDHWENVSTTIERQGYLKYLHGKEQLEIVFPDTIPTSVLKSFIQVDNNKLEDFQVDRMIIPLGQSTEEPRKVYFVSYSASKVYRATSEQLDLNQLKNSVLNNVKSFMAYDYYDVSTKKRLFFPKDKPTLVEKSYYTEVLDQEKFKEVLFQDPSSVKRDVVTIGEKYTDGTSLMDIDLYQYRLDFVNPGSREGTFSDAEDILANSLTFLNDHGGWTDFYRLAEWNEYDQSVMLRLYHQGLPVFNPQGLSEIGIWWGKNEIFRYKRPLFRLQFPIEDKSSKIELPDARTVLKGIESDSRFDQQLVENIQLGYELVRVAPESKVITLKPRWYFRYAGSWIPYESAGAEGGNS